jgi:hypothetical protein
MLVSFMKLSTKDLNKVVRKCPKCDTSEICRAHRVDRWDRVLSLVNVYPYRCRKYYCKNRFHLFGRNA